jgi:hypothetical protein
MVGDAYPGDFGRGESKSVRPGAPRFTPLHTDEQLKVASALLDRARR